MYRVGREVHFSYGHRLLEHDGKCANLHGHNGRVIVEVSSQMLNHQGMVMDFYKIRESIGAKKFDSGEFKRASNLFEDMSTRKNFPEFLTLMAYDYLD